MSLFQTEHDPIIADAILTLKDAGASIAGETRGLQPFVFEETATVGEQTITLRLDFHAITVIEGIFRADITSIVATVRSGQAQASQLAQFVWALTRGHHRSLTINEVTSLLFHKDAALLGLAVGSILDRAFPGMVERKRGPAKRKAPSRKKARAAK